MDVPERGARTGKALLLPLRAAMAAFPDGSVPAALSAALAPDVVVHLSHPFGTLPGAAWYDTAYAPLHAAFPDLERRDLIVVAGRTDAGLDWIGTCGHYAGPFAAPFLDIPPTGHPAAFRFHEFWRVEDVGIAEVQAVRDVPELMMQAGVWPLAPSLGREWLVPGPDDRPAHHTPLDFWRLDAGRIRQNWVLVDLLDVFAQLGVEPLARMREANRACRGFCSETGVALC